MQHGTIPTQDKTITITKINLQIMLQISDILSIMRSFGDDVTKCNNIQIYNDYCYNIHIFLCITEFVAFTAVGKQVKEYTAGEIVQFPSVWTNTNSAYNPDIGIFTCSKTGIYLFSLSLFKPFHVEINYDYFWVQLMVGGSVITTIRNKQFGDVENDFSSSVSVIVHCNKHDLVYVQTIEAGILYDSSRHYNVFSGLLLSHQFLE